MKKIIGMNHSDITERNIKRIDQHIAVAIPNAICAL
jgi:hypothetical protein